MNKMNNILHLPLKAEWYNLIESGIKKEEYREIKPYWMKRLLEVINIDYTEYIPIDKASIDFYNQNHKYLNIATKSKSIKFKDYNKVKFTYGYTKKSMTFEIINITIGKGKIEWGAMDDLLFIIKLGNRLD
jgi:hypothetical protein